MVPTENGEQLRKQSQKGSGYTFDNFVDLKLVKEGGSATVWSARQLDTRKLVALKILRDRFISKREERSAFYLEGRLLMKFDHPRVMNVREIITGKHPTLVMPLFPDSDNLRGWYRKEIAVIEPHKMKIAMQVAEGLQYVHGLKLLHCDIKPENILVNKKGDTLLIDFSLARSCRWYNRMNPLRSAKIKGTPNYLAPEAIRKEAPDYAADIYSLGVTYYELFTGLVPFPGISREEVLSKHLHDHARAPHYVVEGIPMKLNDLILAMMEKKPEKRPDNLAHILSVLKGI